MNNNKSKVIVIGLDGATFKNLKPWMEEGLLPNLKFLIDNGVSGELESTIPRLSTAAWVSFMTGVNPGKHGVFGFVRPFKDKSYKKELVTSKDIKTKTIFEILSDYGKISGVINLPMTYPPFKINGFMISCGLLTPSTNFNFTYPEDLFTKISFKKTDYILEVHPMEYSETEKEKFFLDLAYCSEKRKEISFKLMNTSNWDLFVLVFGEIDRLQHFYWHYIDPMHSKYNPIESQKILPLIIEYYQKLDSIIGEFINYMDDSTSLFIISDHGFGPWEKNIALHKVLEQNKFLFCKKESISERISKIAKKFRGVLHQRSQIYRQTKCLIKLIYRKILKKDFEKEISKINVEKKLGASNSNYWRRIRWNKTIAYIGTTENTILLNLKGREPKGIINPDGEYQQKREQIINLISNLYEPQLKRKLKTKVFKREDVCHGPYSNDAYDVFFEIEDGKYVLQSAAYSKNVFIDSKEWTGRHTKDGILICYGKNFKKSHSVKNAQIIDLAPTILYLLESKIPEYMDGRVLKKIMRDEFIRHNPINFDKDTQERDLSSIEEVYSEQEIEKVEKHLADLGYL